MGVVYATFDHRERLPVALKGLQEKFTSNRRMRDLFTKEAAVWIRLEKHPFIVRAHLVEAIDGCFRHQVLLRRDGHASGIVPSGELT